MKLIPQKLVMWLPYGENFMILSSTVYIWITHVTDGRAMA